MFSQWISRVVAPRFVAEATERARAVNRVYDVINAARSRQENLEREVDELHLVVGKLRLGFEEHRRHPVKPRSKRKAAR